MVMLKCQGCSGEGYNRMSTGGRLSDWWALNCKECDGTGETPATAEEIALLDAMTADFAAEMEVVYAERDAEVAATVADAETFMGVAPATPLPAIVHNGMDAAFFDLGVKRAFANELSISATSRASVVAVSSTSDPDTYYQVTRETCSCIGHERTGRCLHRCYAIWHWWVLECDAVAIAAHITERELIAA